MCQCDNALQLLQHLPRLTRWLRWQCRCRPWHKQHRPLLLRLCTFFGLVGFCWCIVLAFPRAIIAGQNAQANAAGAIQTGALATQQASTVASTAEYAQLLANTTLSSTVAAYSYANSAYVQVWSMLAWWSVMSIMHLCEGQLDHCKREHSSVSGELGVYDRQYSIYQGQHRLYECKCGVHTSKELDQSWYYLFLWALITGQPCFHQRKQGLWGCELSMEPSK